MQQPRVPADFSLLNGWRGSRRPTHVAQRTEVRWHPSLQPRTIRIARVHHPLGASRLQSAERMTSESKSSSRAKPERRTCRVDSPVWVPPLPVVPRGRPSPRTPEGGAKRSLSKLPTPSSIVPCGITLSDGGLERASTTHPAVSPRRHPRPRTTKLSTPPSRSSPTRNLLNRISAELRTILPPAR